MYNPYDLVEISLNEQRLYSRPIAFDGEIEDHINLKGKDGKLIKPTKLATTCPDCGQGLTIDVTLGEPPFPLIECVCYHCKPSQLAPFEPFRNPIKEKLIQVVDIRPATVAAEVRDVLTDKLDTAMITTTVAQRIMKQKTDLGVGEESPDET